MPKVSFGTKKLIKCLVKLGFREQYPHASHQKFMAPLDQTIPKGKRPFIIVILGRKQFDKHSTTRYIGQICDLGFDKEMVLKCF